MNKNNDKELCFTTIHHNSRRKLQVNLIEYAILDSVMRTQKGWYSFMSKEYLSKWLWVPERTLFDYIKKLNERWYIEKSANWRLLKVIDDVVEVLLYQDNSAEVAEFQNKSMQKSPIKSAEIADNNNIYNNILSNDNINNNINIIIKKEKKDFTIINNLLSHFKLEVEKRKKIFVPIPSWDRKNLSNLMKNGTATMICEQKGITVAQLISNVFKLADLQEWWKEHPIDNTNTFMKNWIKIINNAKWTTIVKPVIDKDKAIKDLINNF